MKKLIFLILSTVMFAIDADYINITDEKNTSTKSKDNSFTNDGDIEKYIKMFERSFELFRTNYVDSLNESEVIIEGIKGMFENVDPYTKLLIETSKENADELRTGKYGGIGIQMGLVRDSLTVLTVFDNTPASQVGLNIGDYIVKIDSTLSKGLSVNECSKIIKGDVGTDVTLHIYRPSSKERFDFTLTRNKIDLKKVPYWGIDENNIGYIKLTRFIKNSDKDFKNALLELNEQNIDGLVIDLRSNPGGLLNVSYNILEYLVVRGEELFYQKGRTNRSNKEYKSRKKPIIDDEIPIVVLVNKNSASASEIVSGTLQDLDRAIIIGEKTFGKGLVQHIYDLNDSTSLKITTAKYYLPSGRIIQKQDYLNNGFLTDGLDKTDSIFTTRNGRIVKGGDGIIPDITIQSSSKNSYIRALLKDRVFISFASYYVPKNSNIQLPVNIDDKIVKDFKQFLDTYELEYSLEGEKEYNEMIEQLSKSVISIHPISKHITYESNNNIEFLDEYFKYLKSVQFYLPENQEKIKIELLSEFSKILGGDKEKIRVNILYDPVYLGAIDILLDIDSYYKLLNY